jgi:hypothetical protein
MGRLPGRGADGIGVIVGPSVRCLTLHLQVQHHLGYPLGVTDRHDLALLAGRFGVAVPQALLIRLTAASLILDRTRLVSGTRARIGA